VVFPDRSARLYFLTDAQAAREDPAGDPAQGEQAKAVR
jgi:hypothetical protein